MPAVTRLRQQQPPSADASKPSSSQPVGSRVVYLGHLPHGFYEDELRSFFNQFGQVTKLRVSRNKKTARARSYAFLEFKSAEVAAIAAEAMDGYFLFKQKLVCHLLTPQDQHAKLFKGANKKFAKIPWQKIEAERHNKDKSAEEQDRHLQRVVKRDAKRRTRIQAAGIEYDFAPLEQHQHSQPQHITFEAQE